ncbi:uncharacterized protein LOC121730456 [Aricia agestis]|uniref:uncharacterized protein LOC121730456 n=1 Tax=Aricia agestis TaxID=91739 RepID=UPI001C2099A4|nr:uncharacterized protein LOC121730456 [Aricia agestis]
MSSVPICFLVLALTSSARGISSKVDFDEEEPAADLSKDNEDVEVKHTIVVSTKLKNNNYRGLVNGETGALTYNIGERNPKKTPKDDSGEVPVIKAFKSADTTAIRTPDTRHKTPVYTNYVPTSRHFRDEIDLYPNPLNQWKPTPLYKNVNYWNTDRDYIPLNRPDYEVHRRISEDTARDFYCKKCREMNGFRCQPRNSWITESTTPKIKLDGKIAKLN